MQDAVRFSAHSGGDRGGQRERRIDGDDGWLGIGEHAQNLVVGHDVLVGLWREYRRGASLRHA
jgi:hypothetical protein